MIICLMGASGTGKTSLARLLEKDNYNIIQSFTTRPERFRGEWGHIFIDEVIHDKKDMIAYANLYGEHYYATYNQFVNDRPNVYIINPDGAKQVLQNAKCKVITVYLELNDNERLKRRDDIQSREKLDQLYFRNDDWDIHLDASKPLNEVYKDFQMAISSL